MEEGNNDTQSVSVEEYNKLKSDFDVVTGKLDKLEKIFEERQTKTFDKNKAISKEVLLKELGLVKDPDKTEMELVNEKFATLTKTVEDLTAQIKDKDEKLALNELKTKVRKLAEPYNFIDVSDVLNVIDYTNEDIEGQLKSLAESKKHWIKPQNLGSSFSGANAGNPKDLQEQLREAQKAGNVDAEISLTRQIYEMNRK